MASGLAVVGLAIAAAGIYVAETDDAPGAALMGLLLLIVALVFSVKISRRRE
jgi:drug/metabolite transporter (DMT)-like permease